MDGRSCKGSLIFINPLDLFVIGCGWIITKLLHKRVCVLVLQWPMREKNDLRATSPQNVYWDTVLYTPDYDFSNFDLDKKIKEYQMAIRDGGKFKEIPCLN